MPNYVRGLVSRLLYDWCDAPAPMNWLSSTKTLRSEKNGLMRVERRFGAWRVFSGGNENTGPELTAAWVEAFKALPPDFSAKNILQLGLGGGGTIKELYEHFPGCRITAVEYDPHMLHIAQELQLWQPYPEPKLYEMDAHLFLEKSSENYDLILIDLFCDGKPSDLLNDPSFLTRVHTATSEDGVVLINVFEHPEYLTVAASVLGPTVRLQADENCIGLYSL